MKRLIQLHKDTLNELIDYLGLSIYQALWITFAKGLLVGYVVGVYL
tara:strand:+ start:117 stop:254 length:138 start_codon:yes stop_codon:yes gene_type:complete